jgi:hypothetical protein
MTKAFHCSNCRKDYGEDNMKKEFLDYVQGPDGKPVSAGTRYSIFCGVCEHYVGIADPQRDKTLADFKKAPAHPQAQS